MAPSGADGGLLASLGTGASPWRFTPDVQQQCPMRRVLSHALIDICEDSEISTPKQVSLDAHSPDLAYCIGQCAHQGSRSKMEDRVLVVDLTHDPHFNNAARAVLMAVFDGHAGSEAADHLSQTLLPRLLASPCLACRDYSGALREALLEAERTLLAEYCTSGTTALVVLMVDRMLHIANVGDCRAVVCDDAEARALTWDHKPTHNKLEKARLEASGAKVSADGYVELDGNGERVEGLALSRALGGAPIKLALGCGSGGSSAAGGNGSALPSPAMSPAACTRSNSSAGAVLTGYGSTGGGAGDALAGYGSTGGGAGVPLAENGSAGANLAASGLSGYGSTGGSLSQQPSQTQLHAHQSAEPSLSSPQRPASPSPFIQYPTSRLLEQRSSGGAGAGTGAAGHGPGTTLTPLPSLQHPPGGSNPMPLLSEMGSGLICSHPSASLVVSRQNSGVTSEASVVIAEPELFQYSIHQGSEFLILGSDGLWDKVRNVEAVSRTRRWLGECGQSVDEAASGLVDFALKLGSLDNVSVVLLRFSSRPFQAVGAPRHANSALRRARSVAMMPDSNSNSNLNQPPSQPVQPLTPIQGEDCPML